MRHNADTLKFCSVPAVTTNISFNFVFSGGTLSNMSPFSLKLNVCWCLIHDQVLGPFFFAEASMTSTVYLDILEEFDLPRVDHLQLDIRLKQDGTPPHWTAIARSIGRHNLQVTGLVQEGPLFFPKGLDKYTYETFSLGLCEWCGLQDPNVGTWRNCDVALAQHLNKSRNTFLA